MKVLIVNTYQKSGGAAVAAGRLLVALNNSGVRTRMLVSEKTDEDINVVGIDDSSNGRHPYRGWLRRWHFMHERLAVLLRLHINRDHLWEIDLGNSGTDITRLPVFKEADVIHLSWVNQGMLSLPVIRKILSSGKPVVWTLHDLWPVSGICHYARGCNKFKSGCRRCPLLPGGGSDGDVSSRVWKKKQEIYSKGSIHFVACSKWLENQAKQSGLTAEGSISSIPNPIDINVFHPTDKAMAKAALGIDESKKVVLFVSQRVTDGRKGMEYLATATSMLKESLGEVAENVVVAILGGHSDEVSESLALPSVALGYVEDEERIATIYNAADVFVLPSLEDNLPNTIMEAMACGVPTVGFRVGGIPEMIDHMKNGYVAKTRDAADLAAGLRWALFEADAATVQAEALRKVRINYSQNRVAMKYIEIYNHELALRHYIT